MNIRAVPAFCLLSLAATLCRGEIGIGDPREEVLRQVGKPTSIARRGDHEIFLYPKGARVELVQGKVADVKGPLPMIVATPATPSASAPATEPPADVPAAPAKTAPSSQPAPARKAPATPATAFENYSPAEASHQLAQEVEKMNTPWGMAPPREEAHSPLDSLPSFLAGLALRFTFTVIALKLAFKYWEMDAFWSGTFLIAGIDLVLHAGMELLGPLTGGFSTMVAVENGIPGLVLIYTINRFCFNKRIQNAVITAAAVKLVVTLCYVFAGIAALNMLFR